MARLLVSQEASCSKADSSLVGCDVSNSPLNKGIGVIRLFLENTIVAFLWFSVLPVDGSTLYYFMIKPKIKTKLWFDIAHLHGSCKVANHGKHFSPFYGCSYYKNKTWFNVARNFQQYRLRYK